MKRILTQNGHIEVPNDYVENESESGGIMLYPGFNEQESFIQRNRPELPEGSGGILLPPTVKIEEDKK